MSFWQCFLEVQSVKVMISVMLLPCSSAPPHDPSHIHLHDIFQSFPDISDFGYHIHLRAELSVQETLPVKEHTALEIKAQSCSTNLRVIILEQKTLKHIIAEASPHPDML